MLTKGRIDRTGVISFHDASLAVWEEGISDARDAGGWTGAKAWERQFKRDVFARIVQTLNRLGWTVSPWSDADKYKAIALNHRTCSKGDLQAELSVSGRHIEFKMWQDVQNVESRNGGKYDFNNERRMTYLQRLEMERTRRRIRDYLCNVFTGYVFEPPKAQIALCGITAAEAAARDRRESGHYVAALDHATINNYGNRSRDGVDLTHEHHGARAFAKDSRTGRIVTGQIFYSLNSQWQLVAGRYDLTYVSASDIWVNNPGGLRIKRNADRRRKRLEQELQKAITVMNFERATVLRDILFPGSPALFVVWHEGRKAYHCEGFCGYTTDQSKAGKFTASEAKGWSSEPNRVINLEAA